MSKTIDLLFKNILTGDRIHSAVIHDYFGIHNAIDDNKYSIIYGIYAGLIKYKGISKDLLENCYMTNRLDELIHKKYTYHKSKYYESFINKNISIGETYFNLDDNQQKKMIILTDDYCMSCNTFGYYTKQNYKILYPSLQNYLDCPAPTDCFICGNNICKMCSNYDNKEQAFICYMCENKNIILSINLKIRTYNKKDIETFGVIGNIKKEDVVALLNKQKFRCYVCDDIVLTFGYKPYCLYQFSVDRIDNSLPHNTDNILISCYYCNCIGYLKNILDCQDDKIYKICDNYCHCEKRNISINREEVSIDKINSLKLS
jgi:hypothetical protein